MRAQRAPKALVCVSHPSIYAKACATQKSPREPCHAAPCHACARRGLRRILPTSQFMLIHAHTHTHTHTLTRIHTHFNPPAVSRMASRATSRGTCGRRHRRLWVRPSSPSCWCCCCCCCFRSSSTAAAPPAAAAPAAPAAAEEEEEEEEDGCDGADDDDGGPQSSGHSPKASDAVWSVRRSGETTTRSTASITREAIKLCVCVCVCVCTQSLI